jgi:hypothetical protein
MLPSDMSWQRREGASARYILGHANLTLPELFQLLAQVSGMSARIRIPYGLLPVRLRQRFVARTITHKPFVTLAGKVVQ